MKDKVSLIEVKNKSSLKTLAYMITAIDIIICLQSKRPQP
jgi:hypothetical protein